MPTPFIARLPGVLPLLLATSTAFATGMLPATSVVILEESTREAVMTLTNTDASPALLLTTIEPIPEDSEAIVQVSPPAIRVDGGKKQTVRFILTSPTPLKTERLRRVVFEGVPPKVKGENRVQVNIKQNLPVLIRPAGLPRHDAPWQLLKWRYQNGTLTVNNPSPYVVRLAQVVQTRPDNTPWDLHRAYILPAETLTLTRQQGQPAPGAPAQVTLSPATTWGFTVDNWDAPLESH